MTFWREEFSQEDINFIVERIKSSRTLNSDGNVTVSEGLGQFSDWTSLIVSASAFPAPSQSIRNKVIVDTILSKELPQNFSERDFKCLAWRLLNKITNDLRVYRVAVPIWNKPRFLCGTKKINGVHLNITPSKNSKIYIKIIRERADQQGDNIYSIHFNDQVIEDLKGSHLSLSSVKANNPEDAYERVTTAIYELLGIVNISRDSSKRWRLSFRIGGKLPLSDVLIPPHITVHTESGQLATKGFWYHPWVAGATPNHVPDEKIAIWDKNFRYLERAINKSPWRGECKNALSRYFQAFSNPNLEEAFLDGWRLFENVSGSRKEAIEIKIRRSANVFKDHKEHKLLGVHLALRRNLISHGHRVNADDEEVLLFQMSRFLVPYMERFLLNRLNLHSLKEFWDFLDLPHSAEQREKEMKNAVRKVELLKKANSFRASGVK
jgi:hypothetical protein